MYPSLYICVSAFFPHQMTMGFREPTHMRTAALSDSGHLAGSPTAEADQSNERMSCAISLLPGNMLSRSAAGSIQTSDGVRGPGRDANLPLSRRAECTAMAVERAFPDHENVVAHGSMDVAMA